VAASRTAGRSNMMDEFGHMSGDHSVGFRALLLEDQMAALKSSFMELSILRLAFR